VSDPFYRTLEWRRLREAAQLRDLYRCAVPGCRATATHVDHIVSRRRGGADHLDNLRCLCAAHDNQINEDGSGNRRSDGKTYVLGCGASGRPLDPCHWWNEKIARG
jgi:5-methylcytosine-specific restriction endonuclease McrA